MKKFNRICRTLKYFESLSLGAVEFYVQKQLTKKVTIEDLAINQLKQL